MFILIIIHTGVRQKCGLWEVRLTSSEGLLSELWPTAPPEPVYSSSAHVSQCRPGKQSPSDRQDFHFVPGAESLELRFVARSCGRHCWQSLERVSLLCRLWLIGWASLGSPLHTSPHLHEPVSRHYCEAPLSLSCDGFLTEMSCGWRECGWFVGRPAVWASLSSPPLCKIVRQGHYINTT